MFLFLFPKRLLNMHECPPETAAIACAGESLVTIQF